MTAWAIQNLFNVYKEAQEILADENMAETDKAIKLKGPNGTDHRMLNLMLLLKPAAEEAELAYPDHKDTFWPWFHDRWDYIKSLNIIDGECKCKGCKVDEPVVS
jgi:hypothetical protein